MKKLLMLLIGLLAMNLNVSAAETAKPTTEYVKQCVIYQVHPRVFSKEGTLKAVEKELPQLS